MPSRYLSALVAAWSLARASAQDQTAQVWAVFSYTLNGDKIPQFLPSADALTSYGASQLYAAGSAFRDRYVAVHGDHTGQPGTRISGLSAYLLENNQINILSTADQAILASAQAFMQGLYPPLDQSNITFVDFSFQLANGSTSTAPLGGYQYPQIITLGYNDPLSILVAGHVDCPMHINSDLLYGASSKFWHNWEESAAFYDRLYSEALSGVFNMQAANYANATPILEYLDYQVAHNESLLLTLSESDIGLARWYAGQYVYATNGNYSGAGDIRTVAGQTLASSVLNAFETNIQERGSSGSMTFTFGSYEPMVALASLMQLAAADNSDFYPLPTNGASFSLELFSLETEPYPSYPDPSQLYVRFILRNGTDSSSDSSFVPYPLFGYSPSKIGIPFSEFKGEMESISLSSVTDWCIRCNSSAVFCTGVVDTYQGSDGAQKGLNPVVAGVIGAVVTLVVVALLAVAGFLIFGFRMKGLHKPSLGGYKGDQKMASDSDVTFKNPRWDDSKAVEPQEGTLDTATGATVAGGQERHGSWEMHDHAPSNNTQHPEEHDIGFQSPFWDDHEDELHVHSVIEPTKAREHV